MAEGAGQDSIRGLDIDKLVRGFADEELVLKRFVRNSTTKAREIRWFQKTAGFLDSADTTAITASHIANTAYGSVPVKAGPTWTRNTSYVRKYFVESEVLTMEDLKDTDVDLLATTIRDLVRAVANQVDTRIYNVLTESLSPSNILTGASTAAWDVTATCNPILDLMEGMRAIRAQRYEPNGGVVYMHPTVHKDLLNFLITVKGSSIPNWSSELAKNGVVMEILGLKVVVSLNATDAYALIFLPQTSATWKSFSPMTSGMVEDVGIGKKVRVWEEGECLLTDPKSVYLITSV